MSCNTLKIYRLYWSVPDTIGCLLQRGQHSMITYAKLNSLIFKVYKNPSSLMGVGAYFNVILHQITDLYHTYSRTTQLRLVQWVQVRDVEISNLLGRFHFLLNFLPFFILYQAGRPSVVLLF